MKRLPPWLLFALIQLLFVAGHAQQISPPSILWQRSYGGTNDDGIFSLEQAPRNALVMAGSSMTPDFWVGCLNANGDLSAQYFISAGTNGATAFACQPLRDGGILVGGYVGFGAGGQKTEAGFGDMDYWIVRLDAAGRVLWDRTLGGSVGDYFNTVAVATNGDCLVGGQSFSPVGGNKTSPQYGAGDFWLARLDSSGNKLWDESFGGTGADDLRHIVATRDGGYLLAGFSSSSPGGNKTSPKYGSWDFWLIRFDKDDNQLWEQTYGGISGGVLYAAQQTSDGGFICADRSSSAPSGNKTSPHYGNGDFWAVRVDANGQKLWDESFGGSGFDECRAVSQTHDGGFILAGTSISGSDGNKTSTNFGLNDYWVVRLNAQGQKLWDLSFGGTNDDLCYGIQPTSDGGFLVAGFSYSDANGNKTTTNCGAADVWLVKLGPDNLTRPSRLSWASGEPGNYALLLYGVSNTLYRTEISTNLLDWVPYSTNWVFHNEIFVMGGNLRSLPHCFFRAMAMQP